MLKRKEVIQILGICEKTAYNKEYGYKNYTLSEIVKLKEHYNISYDELIPSILKKQEEKRNEKNECDN